MVRLEGMDIPTSNMINRHFNSCMVRLEAYDLEKVLLMIFGISIPVWYDWKKMGKTKQDHVNDYFNSCMVRLEAIGWISTNSVLYIFQFLYGTIGSTVF